MIRKTTLKEIALKSGFSVSTVSKALSGSTEISESTKETVTKIADALNYRPNFLAAALRNNKSFILGVLIPDLKDEFYLDSLNGIIEESCKHNYKVMVYQTWNDNNKELFYTKMLTDSNLIDGFIFSNELNKRKKSETNHLNTLERKGIPTVHFTKDDYPFFYEKSAFKTGQMSVRKILKEINSQTLKVVNA